MNKTIGTITTITLLLAVTGCTDKKTITPEHTAQTTQSHTEVATPTISNSNVNQFGTINILDNDTIKGVEVICHNCQAHFKLSSQIQKMSLKGDAIVDCPICHKNYLGK